MSKNNPRTVSATCACGAKFTREIRRGRPQVWCAQCMVVPFAKRVTMEIPVEAKIVTDTEGVERIANQWDPHDAVRAQIEANVAEVYAGWPEIRTSMAKAGASAFDIGNAQRDALANAYKAAGVS